MKHIYFAQAAKAARKALAVAEAAKAVFIARCPGRSCKGSLYNYFFWYNNKAGIQKTRKKARGVARKDIKLAQDMHPPALYGHDVSYGTDHSGTNIENTQIKLHHDHRQQIQIESNNIASAGTSPFPSRHVELPAVEFDLFPAGRAPRRRHSPGRCGGRGRRIQGQLVTATSRQHVGARPAYVIGA